MKKNYFSYLVALILISGIFYFYRDYLLSSLNQIDLADILISVFFALTLYSLSGYQYYLIRKKINLNLSIIDIFALPLVMNLWSFIFPFQGSLIFTSIYFKTKFNLKITDNIGIYTYLYLVTLAIGGLFGIILFFLFPHVNAAILFFSILFFLNPVFIYLIHVILSKISVPEIGWLVSLKEHIQRIVSNIHQLWTNKKLSLWILLTNILKLILNVIWFYWIAKIFQMDIHVSVLTALCLIGYLSLIIKFTPDNLGINQWLSSGIISLLGGKPEDAVVLTLYTSTTTIFIIFTLGLLANFYYFRSINLFNLFVDYKNKIKKED